MASRDGAAAPTGTQRMTRSASAHARRRHRSSPRRRCRARAPARAPPRLASMATIVRARLRCRAARAIDEPISPRPTRAMRSKSGVSRGGPETLRHRVPPCRKSRRGGDDEPVRLLVADGEAQAHPAGRKHRHGAGSGRGSAGTRPRPSRVLPASFGKWISRKLPTLGVTLRPKRLDLAREPGEPFLVVARRPSPTWPSSWIAAMPAAMAGPLTLNGPRMRLTASTTWAGADHPAEAQIGKAVDLREGARHHDVLGGRRRVRGRPRNRCGGHIPHRPHRARAAHAAAGPHAGA